MDTTSESKKCFCARCFLPIDTEDRVDIEGQNFHRICSMCCVCRTIPTSLKLFYGHVFCNSCFKTHVLSRLRGDSRVHSNSWWMQWAPTAKPNKTENENEAMSAETPPEEPPRRGICARCLLPVDDGGKVQIGDQCFHANCAQCYFCRAVPTSNVKIYYGQVFCEACFHRHVVNGNRDNPAEFFRACFDSWQSNEFAESMRGFMSGGRDCTPFVFMMQGAQPPFCRCGAGPQDWFQGNEPKKSAAATPAVRSVSEESLATAELSNEIRTDTSDRPETSGVMDGSTIQERLPNLAAAEKIAKLTKYLHHRDGGSEKIPKKWKNFIEQDGADVSVASDLSQFGWMDLQDLSVRKSRMECPKCLWQCGPIFVSAEYFQKQVACGHN